MVLTKYNIIFNKILIRLTKYKTSYNILFNDKKYKISYNILFNDKQNINKINKI